ncbi:hypothetical protein [Vibrio alginolyticus]|uniref:hypothetical protein n=1 Tax=Vibrio alginolyticus TaxID=663 RepID=UPI001BD3BA83|nr:hypothetical protein [Vibrio alginolyticus]MBS9816442.1 hypothetical protein [Vibrio alginolyticus]
MFYLALVVFLTKLYRLSVIGYRLSVIGYRLSVIGYRLSVRYQSGANSSIASLGVNDKVLV